MEGRQTEMTHGAWSPKWRTDRGGSLVEVQTPRAAEVKEQ